MPSQEDPGRALRVLRPGEPAAGADHWFELTRAVADLAGSTALVETLSPGDSELARQAFALAAAADEPVLVLPRLTVGDKAAPARLLRMLVPFDRTSEELEVAKPWIERASRAGIEVEQLHVLADGSLPVMWEGAGHHAASWHAEVRRRSSVALARLSVRRGLPAEHILAASAGVDLLLLCWRGDVRPSRARLIRSVLGSSDVPVLIVRRAPRDEAAGPPA